MFNYWISCSLGIVNHSWKGNPRVRLSSRIGTTPPCSSAFLWYSRTCPNSFYSDRGFYFMPNGGGIKRQQFRTCLLVDAYFPGVSSDLVFLNSTFQPGIYNQGKVMPCIFLGFWPLNLSASLSSTSQYRNEHSAFSVWGVVPRPNSLSLPSTLKSICLLKSYPEVLIPFSEKRDF